MSRITIATCLALIASIAHAQPDVRHNDADYQELQQIVEAQTNCFIKQSKSKSLAKADLETAAYTVLGRCTDETQRYKAFVAAHDPRTPQQLLQHWNEQEREDVETIKQMLAVVRTSK